MDIVTEVWKVVPGTDEGYEVSNLGNVRSTGKTFLYHRFKKPRVLRINILKNGYSALHIRISGVAKNVYVHRLVAQAFIGDCPPRYDVNHKDGNKQNNVVGNLEYMTRSQNNYHAYRILGKKAAPTYGESHHKAKMTWLLVDQLREDYEQFKCYAKLSKKYGIDWTTVKSIVKHHTWNKEKQVKLKLSERAQGMVSLI